MHRLSLFTDLSQETRIQRIQAQYESLANADSKKLRNLIPSDEIWRLFVDGQCIEKKQESWVDFEQREPGYLEAMYKAYHEIFNDHEMTNDFVKKLHKMATQDVGNLLYEMKDFAKSVPGEFRSSESVHYGMNEASEQGLREIWSKGWNRREMQCMMICVEPHKDTFFITQPMVAELRLQVPSRQSWSHEQLSEYIGELLEYRGPSLPLFTHALKEMGLTQDDNQLITLFYNFTQGYTINSLQFNLLYAPSFPYGPAENISASLASYLMTATDIYALNKPLDKLYAIVDLIQSCEQLHPFLDGNTRVFSMLLLNDLLMRVGFPLAILDSPAHFGHRSKKELVDELIKGMRNCMDLLSTRELHNLKTTDIKVSDKKLIQVFQTCISHEEEARKASAITCRYS